MAVVSGNVWRLEELDHGSFAERERERERAMWVKEATTTSRDAKATKVVDMAAKKLGQGEPTESM